MKGAKMMIRKRKKKKIPSLHRWAPDPFKRGSVIRSKKIYDRKGKKIIDQI